MEMGAFQVAGVVAGAVCAILASTNIWQGTMLGVVYGSFAYFVWIFAVILSVLVDGEVLNEKAVEISRDLTWKEGALAFTFTSVVVPLTILAVSIYSFVIYLRRVFTYDDAPLYIDRVMN